MPEKSATRDVEVARIASRQHGVATSAQLEAAGLGSSVISERARRGLLHRVHRGVYAVGHLGLSTEGWWMAAVLACGYGAVLSHEAAAALWGFLRPTEGPIDVSIPTRVGRRRRTGIRVHRCATLARETSLALSYGETGRKRHGVVVMVRRGVPVTSPQRTIDDLRGAAAPYLERRARRQAELAGWRLEGAENDGARSDLEDEFVALCRRHQLPRPELGVRLGKWTVDFLWRAQRLVVETDGFAYHRGSASFEDDHARDLDLRGRGFRVHRFTGRQLREEPERVIADLRAALSSGDRR